jgi:hypothetical protein
MAVVRISYRRTFQDVPYWSQGCDISVEGASVAEVLAEATPENLRKLATVYKRMEHTGDALVAEALGKSEGAPGAPRSGR